MESLLNTMRHNDKRAARVRFAALESVRTFLHELIDQPDTAVRGDALTFMVAVEREQEGKYGNIAVHSLVWGDADGASRNLANLYADIRRSAKDGAYQPDSQDRLVHVAIAEVLGIRDFDASMLTDKGKEMGKGAMVTISFVDSSSATFILGQDGVVQISMATHPVEAIEPVIVKTNPPTIEDALRNLKGSAETPEMTAKRLLDVDYARAMVSGLAVASEAEFQLYPDSI